MFISMLAGNYHFVIEVITDSKKIQSIHKRFLKNINDSFQEKYWGRIGYPGGSFDDKLKFSREKNIWAANTLYDNRYWNGFGIGEPIDWNSNSITCEINFPKEGINRFTQGVFAYDDKKQILILHRGKIGGNSKNITKENFFNNYRGDVVSARDGNIQTDFCVVCELKSHLFRDQLIIFINEVARIKALLRTEDVSSFKLDEYRYFNESFGTSVIENSGVKTINRTHGIVVSKLEQILSRKGYLTANDRNRDLFTYRNNTIDSLFEIKTEASTQCLYAGVGQLLIYGIPMQKAALYLVFPKRLNRQVETKLKELGINSIYYSWKNNLPYFHNIDMYIK
jgi:hypothetical protein